MLFKDAQLATGRLRVLTLICHWMCKCRDWSTIRGLYESIIEEVEAGDCSWTDDFSSYETMIPQPMVNEIKEKKKPSEVYWCKQYQTGQCDKSSPHMTTIRMDEGPVPVIHICAQCWNIHRKRREHPDSDVNCPTKKGSYQ